MVGTARPSLAQERVEHTPRLQPKHKGLVIIAIAGTSFIGKEVKPAKHVAVHGIG
jgi:hypothetical protein